MILYWNSPATSWTFHGIWSSPGMSGLVSQKDETFWQKPWDSLVSVLKRYQSESRLRSFGRFQGWLKIKKMAATHSTKLKTLLSPVESSFAECDSTLIEINRSVIWSLPCPSCWKLIPSGYIRCICPAQPWATRVVPNWLVGWLVEAGVLSESQIGFLRLCPSNSWEVPTTGHCSCTPWLVLHPIPTLMETYQSVSQFAPGKLSSVGSHGIGRELKRAWITTQLWACSKEK